METEIGAVNGDAMKVESIEFIVSTIPDNVSNVNNWMLLYLNREHFLQKESNFIQSENNSIQNKSILSKKRAILFKEIEILSKKREVSFKKIEILSEESI